MIYQDFVSLINNKCLTQIMLDPAGATHIIGSTRVGRKTLRNLLKSQISSKTSRAKKDSTERRHQRHHKRPPGEQLFTIQVVTG